MTDRIELHLSHPDLEGWRLERGYLVPADWRYAVLEPIREKIVGSPFGRRRCKYVDVEITSPDGEKRRNRFTFIPAVEPDLREVWSALAYAKKLAPGEDLMAGVRSVEDALIAREREGQSLPSPDAPIYGDPGPGMSLNDLHTASFLDKHIRYLIDGVGASTEPAAHQLYSAARAAIQQAYQLGRSLRTEELRLEHEAEVERARRDKQNRSAGAGATNKGKAHKNMTAAAEALRLLPDAAAVSPPAPLKAWTLTRLAEAVAAAWKTDDAPSARVIRGFLKSAQSSGREELAGLK